MPTLEEYLADHPEAKPKRGGTKPEHVLQIACKQWLSEALPPEIKWTAVDKGVHFAGDRQARLMQAARAKARGIKNSVPDFHFWGPSIYLAVELKVGGNAANDGQDEWIAGLRALNHKAEVARSVTELEHHLRDAGFPVRTSAKGIDERLPVREAPKRASSKPRVAKDARHQAGLAAIARARNKGVYT